MQNKPRFDPKPGFTLCHYTVKVDHSEVLRVPLTVIAGSQLKRTGGLLSTLIS